MLTRPSRVALLCCFALSFGLPWPYPKAKAPEERSRRPISFFIFPPGFAGATQGDEAVRVQFQEFTEHLGQRSRYGSLGVALNYPYLTFVTGHGPRDFAVDNKRIKLYEIEVRVAHELGLPVLVGFNGGPWFSPGGPFNLFWKTARGGRFLARYQDGQVNESIRTKGPLLKTEVEPFLGIGPYDSNGRDAVEFTLSPYAVPYRHARLRMLALALAEWQRIDRTYPGTIQAFTTDSEVSDFSFRRQPSGDALPIGYESAMTKPFCSSNGIADCAAFFRGRHFTYKTAEERLWFNFRAEAHRRFVADTAASIRRFFPLTPIFTHQLGTLDAKLIEPFRKQDFASPQASAFVKGARPGMTANVYAGRDAEFRELVRQFSDKAQGPGWALAEFNPGVQWQGSRAELSHFSLDLLKFLSDHQVSVVALLSWESNALDTGIKDSGVDDAVKQYLAKGPDATSR